MSRIRTTIYIVIALIVGIGIGGYIFSETRTRPVLTVSGCQNSCFKPNEALGLLASIGIQKFAGFVPSVIKETDKTLAIKSPDPQAPIHDIIIPKKDIKNIGELSEEDKEYIMDAYA